VKENDEGWYGEGGGRRVQDGEHMYMLLNIMFPYSYVIMCSRN